MSSADRGHEAEDGPGRKDAAFGWGPRDLLVPHVLLAISAQRAHGYFIEQYLRGLGLARVEMSTLYRTLRQLERGGLVTSAWEAGPDGPARRVYALTDAGRALLRTGAAALEAYRSAIDVFFARYPSAVGGAATPVSQGSAGAK
ncbi:MAG: helix-turn-helix transcriptional regulator, partial [Candidatus Limnocylindria bacterium]